MQGYSAMVEELDRQRTELERVRKSLSQLTSRATSHDRLVAVTVDARGRAVDIMIEPSALRRYRAERLSALLTTLIAEADTALRTRSADILSGAPDLPIDYADARLDSVVADDRP
ncbi:MULTISPECIES: YbaB/EbfC family nucleoid-associated protein [unclassified Gordonia (in: high G+C Gram-positive bacteria)]|uniref:YbaB/EbfC family nucleoid-associated protein n=1 Tax=unclassified Gordonia (in: high G+C Gram-positive bacteria) TaxID=2657482 RepID=UPI00071E670C|nr:MULTISPECIES: YbaB/EbfC family nucleoid-associated protein [unclassified Gordonia (in: high G+C Gram-positive bacteria)]KSU60722.1 hypothetical protein AS181_02755 [Gordonia sp. SGD-V-85]SCB84806.1 Conserved DNA-binding protein YbaB [Gordonia sp. v-85]